MSAKSAAGPESAGVAGAGADGTGGDPPQPKEAPVGSPPDPRDGPRDETPNGPPDGGRREVIVRKGFLYRLIMFFVHPLYTLVWPTRVRGTEHLPPTGGALIVCNHQSFLDIPLMAKAAGRRHVAFVARTTLADSRILARVMRDCGTVLLDRERRDLGALRETARHLEQGDLVVVFPEGTRTRDGSLAAFKRGAAVPARKAGVPIVPCAISGSYEVWPRQRRLPRPGRLTAVFGPPIDAHIPEAMERAREAVQALLGRGAESPPAR